MHLHLRAALVLLALGAATTTQAQQSPRTTHAGAGSTPIQHVIMIMQENRSFDHYFGTFPGADGIPPGVCMPLDPKNPKKGCVTPFHDVHDINGGGPHHATAAFVDLDDGVTAARMDGFVFEQINAVAVGRSADGRNRHDAMGYHTDAEIPNYWAYAKNFVLQDRFFESVGPGR